jgi:DNA-binding MarR family transcriptional regulator
MTRTTAQHRTDARDEALAQFDAAFKGMMAALRRLRGRDTHRAGELGFAQYHLLFGLSEQSELSTTQLATAADLAPATVTQMLDGLVAMGLVERTRSDRDRRIVTCALTPRGRQLLAEKRRRWEKRRRESLSEFTSDELATAAAVIERLRAMFDEVDAEAR